VVQRYSYSSFGKIFKIENGGVDNTESPDIKSPFTYTNREYDFEIGLYYYRARYYDPALGRFLTEDPHPGERGTPASVLIRYGYVENNPISNIDPDGRITLRLRVVMPKSISRIGEVVTSKEFLQEAASITLAIGAGVATGNPYVAAGVYGFASGAFSKANSGETRFSKIVEAGLVSGAISVATAYIGGAIGGQVMAAFDSQILAAGAGILAGAFTSTLIQNNVDLGGVVGAGSGSISSSGGGGGVKSGYFNDAGTWVP
jgi:RHS repeat-associated protein